jgi:ABC-type transport system substrate-binding protein
MNHASSITHVRARRGTLAGVGALLLIALLAAACGTQTAADGNPGTTAPAVQVKDEGSPVDGGSITVAVKQETDGWNPTINRWSNLVVGSSMFDPLMTMDAHGKAQPWLARSVEPNKTFDSWTLHLQPNVTFQDGSAMDAAAVKMSLDNSTKAPLSSIAFGQLFKGVSVVDPLTVQVDLNEPWASFPESYLAASSGLVLAPAMLNAPDKGQSHPIGTGPFVFKEWIRDNYLKVTKNPHYWRTGEPHLDGIEFRVIVDQSVQKTALQSGDVDMAFNTTADVATGFDPSYQVIRDWQTSSAMIAVNTLATLGGKPNPLADQHARLALAYATDRQAIAASIGDGIGSPTSPFGPDSPWGSPEDQNGYPAYDLAKAKQELDAYKSDTGNAALSVTIDYQAEPTNNQVLQLLQAQWKEAGIDAQLISGEGQAVITKVIGGTYQLAVFPVYANVEPDQLWPFWSSTTAHDAGISLNFTHLTSATIDANLATSRQTADHDTRKRAYDAIIHEINAAAVNLWLYWIPNTLVANSSVRGLKASADIPWVTGDAKTWWGQIWHAAS